MPLVSSTIPNLINGVSQQPAALRLASQAEAVVNCMPSPAEGLKKRPSSNWIKQLFSGTAGSNRPFFTIVDRDGDNQWGVMLGDTDIKVFDLDGTIKTVSTPNGTSYLDVAGEPSQQFRVASIADYTYIVNREKTTAILTDSSNKSPTYGTKSMVFVKGAQYNTTYTVTVAGTAASYTTPVVGSGQPTTTNIASQLASSLSGNGALSGYTITATDYIIEISKNDGGDYSLKAIDTYDGGSINAIKDSVSDLSRLPTIGREGFLVKIQGVSSSEFDDWYLVFETTTGGTNDFGPGTWKETVAPGIDYKIDPANMPHVLIKNADGTFTFQQHTWDARLAGDANTAPNPSFIGHKINNITIFRNRLALLTDENVVLSAADSYAQFFPQTVQTVLDNDPIDLTAGGNQINILHSAVPFASTLLLFSKHGQFRMDSGSSLTKQPLTPKSATITAMTTYETLDGVDPVAAGRTVFFPIPRGDFSGLREYFLADTSNPVPASEEVTAAIPRFIPGDVVQIAPSVSEEMVAILTKANSKRIYFYKYFFQGDTKLQSAWSYWEVQGNKSIIAIQFLNSDLYALVEYSDDVGGVYLEKISCRPETVDENADYELLLDRKAKESDCTAALTNAAGLDKQTTITLPYPRNTGATIVVVGREAANNTVQPGQVIHPIATGTSTITVRGDLTASACKYFVGELYPMTYEFSTPYLKEQPQGGGIAIIGGPRLQMRMWTVIHDKTGHFEIWVTPRGRTTKKHPFNGLIMGDGTTKLGQVAQEVGKFRVPVQAQNIDTKIELYSNSPLPCRVQSAEWEGFYFTRTERL